MANTKNNKCPVCGAVRSSGTLNCPYCKAKYPKESATSTSAKKVSSAPAKKVSVSASVKKVAAPAKSASVSKSTAGKSKTSTKALGIKFSVPRIIIFVVIAALCGVSFLFSSTLEGLLNAKNDNLNNEMASALSSSLRIHYIDVGQADCTVIELPDGKIMMIDCGLELKNTSKNSTELMNYLDGTIFAGKPTPRIDYFIITHADYDHIAASEAVLKKYDIGRVYRPHIYYQSGANPANETFDSTKYMSDATNTWRETIKAINDNAEEIVFVDSSMLPITHDDAVDTKDYTFTFYGPVFTKANGDWIKYTDKNEYSPVMVLNNNGKTFMFTGDADSKIEKTAMEFIKRPGQPGIGVFDVDVLKCGHHGSKTSSCAEFLTATTPAYVVVSVGESNTYGHPNNEAINRFADAKATVLRTDKSGSIVAFVEGGDIKFVLGSYDPSMYRIKWSYVAISIIVLAAVICFIPKRRRA